MKTRVVEMFIGVGTDSGSWFTDFVNIPIDTPEEKIEEVAKDVLKAELAQNDMSCVICGVYSVPLLDEQPTDWI